MEIIKATRLHIALTVSTLNQFTYLLSRVRKSNVRFCHWVRFVFFFCEFHFVRWQNSIVFKRTLSFDWVQKSNFRFCSVKVFFLWVRFRSMAELNRTKEFDWVRKPNVRCDTPGLGYSWHDDYIFFSKNALFVWTFHLSFPNTKITWPDSRRLHNQRFYPLAFLTN